MNSNMLVSTIIATFITILNVPMVLPQATPSHFNHPLAYSTYDTISLDDYVEDQGTASTCWAISANTLFELFVQKEFGVKLNLSTDHLIRHAPVDSTYLSGGNFDIALAYYLNRLGPVENPSEMSYWLKSYSEHTQDMYAAKHYIKTKGAVITSIFFDAHRTGFYNESTHAYYNPSLQNPITHNVILVGWDDTYSRHNFRNKPDSDGAFIAQNSFGSDWGKNGLFYISYEDVHVLDTFYAIESIESFDQNSIQYYYDETGITHFEGYPDHHSLLAINTFKNTSGLSQKIDSIGLYTNEKNIRVHLFAGNSTFDPNDFTLPDSMDSHLIRFPGYHRLALSNPIHLSSQADFYIGVEFSGESPFLIPMEAPYPHMDYSVTAQPYEGYTGYGNHLIPNHLFRENSSIGIRAYTITD